MPSTLERFWTKVDRREPHECWPWQGARNAKGYGLFSVRPKMFKAHRFAWQIEQGDPAGLFVCHSCDNRACCNPDHLWLGTHADNMRDMVAKGRSACVRGNAKLTPKQVVAIRDDPRTSREIATEYGVSYSTICAVRNGQNWKGVGHSVEGDTL
jgi:hypothetical protein